MCACVCCFCPLRRRHPLRRYFSYEHFYVIYCKFWELDTDHDFFIDKDDLLRYGNHALTYRIVERIFAQVCKPRRNLWSPDLLEHESRWMVNFAASGQAVVKTCIASSAEIAQTVHKQCTVSSAEGAGTVHARERRSEREGEREVCACVCYFCPQVPRKFTSKAEGKMGYEDFVWFILSEEDKSCEPSLEYW